MAELVDVLDAAGRPTGGTATRRDAHVFGMWHRVAHLWLYRPDGSLLQQRRSAMKEASPGKWDSSAAGHVEAGEGAGAAVLRELREELGLRLPAAPRPLGEVFQEDVLNAGSYVSREAVSVFLAPFPQGAGVRLQLDEVTAVRWISGERLLRLASLRDAGLVPRPAAYRLLFRHLSRSLAA